MKSVLAICVSLCVLCQSSFCFGSNDFMATTTTATSNLSQASAAYANETRAVTKNAQAAAPDETLELLISPEAIDQKVKQIAAQIDKEYRGEEITMIMVMKGAVCVASDLMRALKTPTNIEFIKASSYGMNGTKQGQLKLTGIEHLDLKGKNVLLVDDIFDSGKTMTAIVEQLKDKQPKSIKSVVAFIKNVKREIAYRPDYVLFEVENKFIVGYGLDYKERYRGLPGIYLVKNND